ncbi:MAG: YkvA family protein [Burkholderiaceae bacterium]
MFNRLRRLVRLAGSEVTILWFACRHPATPLAVKLGAGLLAVYLLSPIDLVPDALPVLGWLDDATILAFGIPALLKLMPAGALTDARSASERFLSKWAFWRRA